MFNVLRYTMSTFMKYITCICLRANAIINCLFIYPMKLNAQNFVFFTIKPIRFGMNLNEYNFFYTKNNTISSCCYNNELQSCLFFFLFYCLYQSDDYISNHKNVIELETAQNILLGTIMNTVLIFIAKFFNFPGKFMHFFTN